MCWLDRYNQWIRWWGGGYFFLPLVKAFTGLLPICWNLSTYIPVFCICNFKISYKWLTKKTWLHHKIRWCSFQEDNWCCNLETRISKVIHKLKSNWHYTVQFACKQQTSSHLLQEHSTSLTFTNWHVNHNLKQFFHCISHYMDITLIQLSLNISTNWVPNNFNRLMTTMM